LECEKCPETTERAKVVDDYMNSKHEAGAERLPGRTAIRIAIPFYLNIIGCEAIAGGYSLGLKASSVEKEG
jgi:hypothetical protein